MTTLKSELRAQPGTVLHSANRALRFRAMFITLREYNSDGLLALTAAPDSDAALTKAVLETDDNSPWWDGPEYNGLLAWLETLMQACAPTGCRWGPHVAFPDNYGYWPIPKATQPSLTSNERRALDAAQKLYEALDACMGVNSTTSQEDFEASALLTAFFGVVFTAQVGPVEDLANLLETFLATHKKEPQA